MSFPRWASTLLRPLPLAIAVAWLAAPAGPRLRSAPGDRSAALVAELATRSLEARPSTVHWIDGPSAPLSLVRRSSRAIVLARSQGSAWDVHLVHARLSPEGALLRVDDVFNLTNTSAVDEDHLTVNGEHVAWSIGGADRTYRVELADLHGESLPSSDGGKSATAAGGATEEWTRLSRAQRAIAEWQRTGQLAGVGRRSFKLDPAARRVSLRAEPSGVEIDADGRHIAIPWTARRPIDGERFVREEDRTIARPGNLVTWAVDRARAASWFGDDRMQWTKAVAYAILDRVDRVLGSVAPPAAPDPVGEGLGAAETAARDPETGWPPAPIPALVNPPLADEGKWLLLDHDPFVRTSAAVPSPLVTTYLRAEASRLESRVYIVEWDPRQVELNVVPGTEEPLSATGETGSGMIPRRPEILSRLVGAFNGGFQSTHGDFGMMSDRSLLVPPKPYAATIARLADGATAFGTWPEDATVPEEIVSFRQNLTALVASGKFNPYLREWWGGVPHDWEDETHTVRSGLCMTRDGFVAYFYGTQIDHKHLGQAMLSARCDYGVHLDMNQGHTGLELYRADRADLLPPLSGKVDGHWQTEGDVLEMPGYRFRGRRLIRNLQLMHFPRYIRRGARDYFYLMLRPLLPRAPLTSLVHDAAGSDESGTPEGEWTVKGLPQHGWPFAIATTSVRPDPGRPETKIRVLAVDPATVRLADDGDGSAPTILAIDARPGDPGDASLWLATDGGRIAGQAPAADARLLATGSTRPGPNTAAAACVDENRQVVYAEVATAPDPRRDGETLDTVLSAVPCTDRLFFEHPLRIAVGGTRDLSEHPLRLTPGAVRLVRAAPRGVRPLFPDTPVVPPSRWQALQRPTRTFPKDETKESAARSPADAPTPAAPLEEP